MELTPKTRLSMNSDLDKKWIVFSGFNPQIIQKFRFQQILDKIFPIFEKIYQEFSISKGYG